MLFPQFLPPALVPRACVCAQSSLCLPSLLLFSALSTCTNTTPVTPCKPRHRPSYIYPSRPPVTHPILHLHPHVHLQPSTFPIFTIAPLHRASLSFSLIKFHFAAFLHCPLLMPSSHTPKRPRSVYTPLLVLALLCLLPALTLAVHPPPPSSSQVTQSVSTHPISTTSSLSPPPPPRALSRIVAGKPVYHFVARHVANLVIHHHDSTHTSLCTGTVIARRWLLTAAHCLVGHGLTYSAHAAKSYAYIGSYKSGPLTSSPKLSSDRHHFHIAAFHVIKKHSATNPYDHRNDIALVELTTDIPLFVAQPMAISRWSNDAPHVGAQVSVVGYGTVGQGQKRPGQLLRATMKTQSWETCLRTEHPYYHLFMTRSVMFCASAMGFPKVTGGDICSGDSGGPLFAWDARSKRLRQYGIASFGTRSCGAKGSVSWFVKVGTFAGAIRARLQGQKWQWRRVV